MKIITLTRGKFAIIDDEDFDRVSKYSWHFREDKKSRSGGVAATRLESTGSKQFITLHQFILRNQPGLEIDHRDGDTLNCQKYNLRHCTHAENMRNMRLHRYSSTRVKGVDFHKRMGKYRARICFNYKHIHLGFYHDIWMAALAYDLAAQRLHGEFALTNCQIEARQAV